jgi:hypothetical protein
MAAFKKSVGLTRSLPVGRSFGKAGAIVALKFCRSTAEIHRGLRRQAVRILPPS